jgi:hypothetical protein
MFMSSRSLLLSTMVLWDDVSHVDDKDDDDAVVETVTTGAAPVSFRNLSASRLRIEVVGEFDPSLSPAAELPGG